MRCRNRSACSRHAWAPPDLAVPFTPSHVSASDFNLGTQPLTVTMSIRTDAANLAYMLTESIGSLNTPYWIDSQKNKDAGIPGWQDITTEANRYRSTISHDLAFFAKDDFKITKSLTLNLREPEGVTIFI